jgi:hypothetical protein
MRRETPLFLRANLNEAQLTPLQQARTFARYAYVPEPDWNILDIFAGDDFITRKRDLARMTTRDLLDQMGASSDAAFHASFSDLGNDVVVPLSGGRDSRLILCMAIEHGLRDRVVAVTWGMPGCLDWEIARRVAAHLGVRHVLIDTTARPITFADLRRAFNEGGHWCDLVPAHFNRRWRAEAPPGATAVIGFLCGSAIGAHYGVGHETLDLDASIAAFDRMNQRTSAGKTVIDKSCLRLLSADRVSWPEQLDLVFRQQGYLRRLVTPKTFSIRTPFATREWMQTMYALPAGGRVHGNLFSAFLIERFPKAYAIGTGGCYGLRADAPQWRRRAARQWLRLRYAIENEFRVRQFLTLDKYGDERSLLAAFRADENTPRQIERLLAQRCDSRDDARRTRLRIMLLCNLLFEFERSKQSQQMDAA